MSLRRLFRRLTLRRQHDQLHDELEHHRALVQQALERQGHSPTDASAQSRRVMGNAALAVEHARDVWVVGWADRLWRDTRFAWRGLRREPAFAITAIFTLALGVATTTTVFSVADAELWRPLPFPRPHELVAIAARGRNGRGSSEALAGADLLDWRAGAPALIEIAGDAGTERRTLALEVPEALDVTAVTSSYFSLLGRTAVAGRTFEPGDAHGSDALLLTERGWTRLFDRSPTIAGRAVTLDGKPHVIIGVVRSNHALGAEAEAFVPIDESSSAFIDRSKPFVYDGVIGRLAPGATAAVARAQLTAVDGRLAAQYAAGRADRAIVVEDLGQYYQSGVTFRPLVFFLCASLVVLLLAATNVAALLVSRSFKRSREFALRKALGGGQGALARQLIVEGAWLSIPAAAIGTVFSMWFVRAISTQLPSGFLLRGTDIQVDVRAWLFALSAAIATSLAFMLTPLLMARRTALSAALGPGARTGSSAREGRARLGLLVVQIALTVILLAGAALFLRSFVALTRAPLGFDPVNAVSMRVSLNPQRYPTDASVVQFADALAARVRAVPGVRNVAIGTSSPLGSGPLGWFAPADQPWPPPGNEQRMIIRSVSPGFFRTLSTAVLAGREFSADDNASAPRVAIINQTAARRVFGDASAVGRGIAIQRRRPRAGVFSEAPQIVTVVGVVANTKEVGINEVEFADVYLPFAQAPSANPELVARTTAGGSDIAGALKRAVADVDASLAVSSVRTFEQRVNTALQGDRFNVILVTSFAVLALTLAVIGIYGAIAYVVEGRRKEFGVRLALGARPSHLLAIALGHASRVAIAGGIAGVGGTLLVSRLLGDSLYLVPGAHVGMLYGVTTADPWTLAAAFIAIVIVALGAGFVPARRVGRVDPMLALRND